MFSGLITQLLQLRTDHRTLLLQCRSYPLYWIGPIVYRTATRKMFNTPAENQTFGEAIKLRKIDCMEMNTKLWYRYYFLFTNITVSFWRRATSGGANRNPWCCCKTLQFPDVASRSALHHITNRVTFGLESYQAARHTEVGQASYCCHVIALDFWS